MRSGARAVILSMLLACAAGLVWLFRGEASDRVVGNANVVGGVAGVFALALAVMLLWPRAARRHDAAVAVDAELVDCAVEYLARETLRYRRVQAKDRRITTPSPAAVRWNWSDEDVAVPLTDLRHRHTSGPSTTGSEEEALTAGVVTQLREQLYDRLDDRHGRMVILGGPGAGKTAALLLLLLDVLEHRRTRSAQPVPVWLTLGGFSQRPGRQRVA